MAVRRDKKRKRFKSGFVVGAAFARRKSFGFLNYRPPCLVCVTILFIFQSNTIPVARLTGRLKRKWRPVWLSTRLTGKYSEKNERVVFATQTDCSGETMTASKSVHCIFADGLDLAMLGWECEEFRIRGLGLFPTPLLLNYFCPSIDRVK